MLTSHVLLSLPNLAFGCVVLLFFIPYSGYLGFESGLGGRILWLLWFFSVAPSKSRDNTWLRPRPLPFTSLIHSLFIISLYSRSCRSQWPRRKAACLLVLRFESRQGHGCPSLVSVVCCQAEVSTSGWSLVQRSRTECGVPECDREASIIRRPWPTMGRCVLKNSRSYY